MTNPCITILLSDEKTSWLLDILNFCNSENIRELRRVPFRSLSLFAFTEPLTAANDVGDAYIMLDKADNDKRHHRRRRRRHLRLRRLRRRGDSERVGGGSLFSNVRVTHLLSFTVATRPKMPPDR